MKADEIRISVFFFFFDSAHLGRDVKCWRTDVGAMRLTWKRFVRGGGA